MSSFDEAPAPSSSGPYIIDPERAAELTRLMQQDRLVTEHMGGLLPEVPELPEGGGVLDLGCGPGLWAMELAFAHPRVQVVGVDINPNVVEFATIQAWSRGLENVRFRVMDVMQPLDFPDRSFDVINARLIIWGVLPEAWPRMLQECRRLLKPGGLVRLTEAEQPLTSSPAYEQICQLLCEAVKKSGRGFSPDGRHFGITPMLARLLRQAGFVDVRLRASVIDWSVGTPAYHTMFRDASALVELIRPFLLQYKVATREELDSLTQEAIAQLQLEDFCALWTLVTAWGRQPE
jgi:ubiquinone/menaquinone biosynthesis C-methylase UbiE